jgi:hypothetical protein
MGWDEPVAEEERFAGSLARYVEQTVELRPEDAAFALRWEEDLLGRLTRPGEYMVAETTEGRWELRRPRNSISRIDLVDPHTASVGASYRRRVLRPGTITTPSAAYRLRHRLAHPEWTLTDGSTGLLELRPADGTVVLDVSVLGVPSSGSDLGPLALLCCYVVLMNAGATAGSGGGPDTLPF